MASEIADTAPTDMQIMKGDQAGMHTHPELPQAHQHASGKLRHFHHPSGAWDCPAEKCFAAMLLVKVTATDLSEALKAVGQAAGVIEVVEMRHLHEVDHNGYAKWQTGYTGPERVVLP